ncbi:MAG: hydroxymethylglutaryl-CoA reductase, degradative [Sandaracinaceae bacterium]
MTSAIPRFYQLSQSERRERIGSDVTLSPEELSRLCPEHGLSESHAERMVENALGVFGLPLGVCVNLRVNGDDVLVPMAVEEPSVIAASSFASKLLREGAGVEAIVSEPLVIGQIQVLEVADPASAERAILEAQDELLALANSGHRRLIEAGGGAREIEVRHLPKESAEDPCGDMLVVHVAVDVRDAMGANAVNSMCERLAPRVEELTGGRVALRILSNLTDRRTVTVIGRVPFGSLEGKGMSSGRELAERIEEASVFAERDPYRACTHNKGIMNGVDAALIALGQDWRAIEAGAHAYAAKDGRYTALARWRAREDHLEGRMTIPLAVGTVGGVAKSHPVVEVNRKIARIENAAQLASICASVGLAQNLGALRALAAEGIQRGHMRLHARNVAVEAGATEDEVLEVATRIADLGQVNADAALRVLAELRDVGTAASGDTANGDTANGDTANGDTAWDELATPRVSDVAPRPITEERPVIERWAPAAPSANVTASATDPRPRRPYTPAAPSFGSWVKPPAPQGEDSMSEITEKRIGPNVLVTGAAGHLGANLVRRLLADGHAVRVLLRKGSDNSAMDGLDVERFYGDLRDPASLKPAVQGAHSVFHAAANISTVPPTPAIEREVYECNVYGTRNILRAAGDAGVNRVVVTGSFSATGHDLDDPSAAGHEDMPHWPFEEMMPYTRTKVLVEHETLKACVEGIDAVIATSCAILGPNDYKPSRMGKLLVDFAHGKMNAFIPGGFDFVSAEDLCDGHVLAYERGRTGQKYILSTSYMEVDALMEIYEEVTGRPRPKLRLPGAVMAPISEVSSFVLSNFFPAAPQRLTPYAVATLRKRRRADTTKAQRELGYRPTSIRKAIHAAHADFARRGLVPSRPGTTAEALYTTERRPEKAGAPNVRAAER